RCEFSFTSKANSHRTQQTELPKITDFENIRDATGFRVSCFIHFMALILLLVCKNGIHCRSRGQASMRPNQSYFAALQCNCQINSHFDNAENKLEVTVSDFKHNHEISAELLCHFPYKTRLGKDCKEFIVKAAQLGANVKLIAEEIPCTSNKNKQMAMQHEYKQNGSPILYRGPNCLLSHFYTCKLTFDKKFYTCAKHRQKNRILLAISIR
uniref:Uncharacterized protein n=1 Tax=Romanomermis culicivorax TaxID=13658 RepID=A0A915L721_ROMCU